MSIVFRASEAMIKYVRICLAVIADVIGIVIRQQLATLIAASSIGPFDATHAVIAQAVWSAPIYGFATAVAIKLAGINTFGELA